MAESRIPSQSGEVSSPKQSERREVWRQRIAEQKDGGQTVRVFCRERGFSEHSFYWWRRQLGAGAEKAIRFALVETAAASVSGMHLLRQTSLELVLQSGERLQIPADESILRLVFRALREQGQADR